jgi:GR25 family glycosyltransferase involved in LPS biosynthesis
MSFQFTYQNTFCISPMVEFGEKESIGKVGFQRWLQMENRIMNQNPRLLLTRWPAATPANGCIVDRFVDYLSDGQKACAQSHINIWRHMIRAELPYVFILEDDAVFHKDWRLNLSKLDLEKLNWDAIFLNGSELVSPSHEWKLVTEQYLTGGYILSFSGAQWLLKTFGDCFHASDWMTTRLQLRGQSWSYFPWLVIQEGNESMIGSEVEEDHQKVLLLLQNEIQNYHL